MLLKLKPGSVAAGRHVPLPARLNLPRSSTAVVTGSGKHDPTQLYGHTNVTKAPPTHPNLRKNEFGATCTHQ